MPSSSPGRERPVQPLDRSRVSHPGQLHRPHRRQQEQAQPRQLIAHGGVRGQRDLRGMVASATASLPGLPWHADAPGDSDAGGISCVRLLAGEAHLADAGRHAAGVLLPAGPERRAALRMAGRAGTAPAG